MTMIVNDNQDKSDIDNHDDKMLIRTIMVMILTVIILIMISIHVSNCK